MALKIWMDGGLVDQSAAKVSVYDHGLLYGDGVFEGMRVYHGKLFEADAHFRRLFESAKSIRLEIPFTAEQLRSATDQTVKANNFTDCYVRLVVTRGAGTLGLDPHKCPTPCVFIIADLIALYPAEMYEKGMPVITASVVRNHPNAIPPRVKSLNYLNNILAKMEATDAGVPEAIMLNHVGNVCEASADNVFIVKDGTVLTPPATEGALEGITRKVIIDLCRRNDVPFREAVLQRHDLYIADEMFLTGSGAEVIPVTTVDRRPIGTGTPGPVTGRLIRLFREYVRH
jgi:branched-chain amino acid aminotransferase